LRSHILTIISLFLFLLYSNFIIYTIKNYSTYIRETKNEKRFHPILKLFSNINKLNVPGFDPSNIDMDIYIDKKYSEVKKKL